MTLVHFAALAPSSHNTQPWRFRVAAKYIDVIADFSRKLPENDPNNRELLISCGCALMNIRLAAAHFRVVPEIEYHPDFGRSEVLARMVFNPTNEPEEDPQLYDAIQKRRTSRVAFAHRAVPEDLKAGLQAPAAREGAWLDVVTEDKREGVAQLVAEGDEAQWAQRKCRGELASWLRPRSAGDGLTTNAALAPFTRTVVRFANLGRAMGRKDKAIALAAPVLAVLGTYGDTEADWLVAGQALQRMLLWAVSNGLQAGFLNQPIQVPALRDRLAQVLGVAAFPQIIVRLGFPDQPIPAAPRRDLDEVATAV